MHSSHGPPLSPAAYAGGEGIPLAQIVAEAIAMAVQDGSGTLR